MNKDNIHLRERKNNPETGKDREKEIQMNGQI
jgi:hypothetical protein